MVPMTEKVNFWMYDWKVQSLKTEGGFKLDGKMNVTDAEAAALLLLWSQKTGYALKHTVELVKVADEGY